MRKGQAEIIAILGIMIVAVVAILLATQQPSSTQPVTREQQSIRDSLENLIRSGAHETMRALGTNGGYEEPAGEIIFLGKQVPYWQKSGQSQVPPTKENFVRMLEEFINENKDSFVSGLSGEIELGRASVEADFLENKAIIKVNLPATLNNNPVNPIYDVEILTRFGDIMDFAEEFTTAQSGDRYLEYFILASMFSSPIENGAHTTPFFFALTRCGEFVFRTWDDIKPEAEDRIAVTLAHTYMPGKAPFNVGDITSYSKYIIPQFNGNTHSGIEVSFHLPDGFELEPGSFYFTPNPISAVAKPIPMTGVCVSDPVYVNYYMRFPVVVRAKDPLTGNSFHFAHEVFINGNSPGEWTQEAVRAQELQALLCADTKCSSSISVTDLSGSPVEGASVYFLGCQIGKTDSSGSLRAPIPCGRGSLQVIKPGHEIYSQTLAPTELGSFQTTVPRTLNAKVNFYQVNLLDYSSTYEIDSIETLPPGKKVMLTLRSFTGKPYSFVFDGSGILTQVPAGEYSLLAVLMDDEFRQAFGQVELLYDFSEDLEELNVYVPTNYQFSQLSQAEDLEELTDKGFAFTEMMEQCGIGPVSEAPVDDDETIPCIRSHDQL